MFTLFNALTRTRDAIVADIPGTRDRQHYSRWRRTGLIDTGGLVDNPSGNNGHAFADQVAVRSAMIIFLAIRAPVDRAGSHVAGQLRRAGRPVTLAINKAEGLTLTWRRFSGSSWRHTQLPPSTDRGVVS